MRKEIKKSAGQAEHAFAQELRNLSLLSHLKHPNLVELFCSYRFRDTYTFVFDVANGGTLAQLLRGDLVAPYFSNPEPSSRHNHPLFAALADLASAVETVHNFSSVVLDVKLTGCHHDIAPRNIFIRDKTLVLGDFGLSTFKAQEEGSLTAFKEIRSDYAAPECQRFQDTLIQTAEVTRASDIWSFGCILAEVATFLAEGSKGVEKFREARCHDVTNEITWFRFHHGPAGPSLEVQNWLMSLRQRGTSPGTSLITLCEEMLSFEPTQRPRAVEVMLRLQYIAVFGLARLVSASWEQLGDLKGAADLRLGRMNFEGWSNAFETFYHDRLCQQPQGDEVPTFQFELIQSELQDMSAFLDSLVDKNDDYRRRCSKQVHQIHVRLLGALPIHCRDLAKTHSEQLILQDVQIHGFNFGPAAGASNAVSHELGLLVTVKLLIEKERQGLLSEKRGLFLKDQDVKLLDDIEQHTRALIERSEGRFLVEWVEYSFAWADDETGRQFRDRVASVASLLHNDDAARIPSTLHCRGLYHRPSRRSFGLVYELPSSSDEDLQILTLNQMLHGGLSYRPTLEVRIRLGYALSQAVYQFHSVGWLHRNLNPTNILFCPAKEADRKEWAQTPIMLGFASSRQNEADAATLGPDNRLNYHHPDYLQNKSRYRQEYDYYSMGMMLLEIGHWAPLVKLTESKRFRGLGPEQFTKEILNTRLAQVELTMGSRYKRVVMSCLSGHFAARGRTGREDDDLVLRRMFKAEVVDALDELFSAVR